MSSKRRIISVYICSVYFFSRPSSLSLSLFSPHLSSRSREIHELRDLSQPLSFRDFLFFFFFFLEWIPARNLRSIHRLRFRVSVLCVTIVGFLFLFFLRELERRSLEVLFVRKWINIFVRALIFQSVKKETFLWICVNFVFPVREDCNIYIYNFVQFY